MTDQPRDPETGQFVSQNAANGTTANALTSEPEPSGFRQAMAQYLGSSNYEERDIYTTFDWPEDPTAGRYWAVYTRHPFARPVVDRPTFTSWRDAPDIRDGDNSDTETSFEKKIEQANRELDLWSYGARLDRLAGIGRYALMVFITQDVDSPAALEKPLPKSLTGDGLDKVPQIKVFGELSVDNIEWGGIEAAKDGRWGLPVSYDVDFETPESGSKSGSGGGGKESTVHTIHHSRTVAAPATRLLGDEFYGRPRLEPVINTLRDIEKTLGSIAELAYRGADKGLAINFDPEKVDVSGDSLENVNEELQRWEHGLQPFLRLVGGDIQTLGGEVADPSALFDADLSALASATQIPKRVFEGNGMGALSGAEEDTQAYFGMIRERRGDYVEPHIIRPVIEWLVSHGVIPKPASNYPEIEWPSLRVLTAEEEAEITKMAAKNAPGAVRVKEVRDGFGFEPAPDGVSESVLNSFLSEIANKPAGGSAGAALDAALAEGQQQAESAARTESRVMRGQEADD